MKKPAFLTTAYLLLPALLVMNSFSAHAQEQLTLRQALDRAQSSNLQVKQAEFQAALTEQDVRQAKMNFYPTVNAGVDGSLSWGRSFDQLTGNLITQSINSLNGTLATSVPIFQGFQRVHQVSANKYLLLADQSNIERVKSDLILAVVTTYLEALTNQDIFLAAQQQLSLSRSQLDVEQINFEVGNKTLADISQSRSQVAADELNVTSAQNAYELSILNLKQLMEMDPSIEIVLEKPPIPDYSNESAKYAAQELYLEARKTYPEIQQAAYNSLVAKTNIDIMKSALYPQLSLSGRIGTGYSSASLYPGTRDRIIFRDQLDDNLSQFVGFSLSIPIFNNFRTRISVAKARISYENALLSQQQAENNLNKIIHQAVLDLRAAEKSLLSNEQAFESSREAFQVIKQRYDVGLANSIELNTSQTNMNRAEFELIQARYNLIFRSKVIDFYLGKPITFSEQN